MDACVLDRTSYVLLVMVAGHRQTRRAKTAYRAESTAPAKIALLGTELNAPATQHALAYTPRNRSLAGSRSLRMMQM